MSFKQRVATYTPTWVTRLPSWISRPYKSVQALAPEPTTRKDANDAATVNEAVTFTNVPANINGVIGLITTERPAAGQVFTYAFVSGNGAGDFQVSSAGELSRVAGHTLTGPYALVIRVTEGSPLYRSFDVDVSVTVA